MKLAWIASVYRFYRYGIQCQLAVSLAQQKSVWLLIPFPNDSHTQRLKGGSFAGKFLPWIASVSSLRGCHSR